jgi:hypothetical protein
MMTEYFKWMDSNDKSKTTAQLFQTITNLELDVMTFNAEQHKTSVLL